jgi:hypothetical protein
VVLSSEEEELLERIKVALREKQGDVSASTAIRWALRQATAGLRRT